MTGNSNNFANALNPLLDNIVPADTRPPANEKKGMSLLNERMDEIYNISL